MRKKRRRSIFDELFGEFEGDLSSELERFESSMPGEFEEGYSVSVTHSGEKRSFEPR